ncbi:MAG: hypothetical protein CSA29_03020 [Desulfobacterales bacterium]|nr:MAG: hypothetical protein CSA29_03020 [Desulfobacterales bacterium]
MLFLENNPYLLGKHYPHRLFVPTLTNRRFLFYPRFATSSHLQINRILMSPPTFHEKNKGMKYIIQFILTIKQYKLNI